MQGEGINQLMHVIDERIIKLTDKAPMLDFGSITDDMSLLTNYFPVPLPQNAYTVCRSVTWGAIDDVFYRTQDTSKANSGEHTHSNGGRHSHPLAGETAHTHVEGGEKEQHVHDVLVGPKFRQLMPGDRVLVAWVGAGEDEDREPVVIDLICSAERVKQPAAGSVGNGESNETYTVTFNSGGASGTPPKPVTQNAGQTITLPGQGNLKKTYDFFIGWEAEESDMRYSEGDAVKLSKNAEFTAQWMSLEGGGNICAAN
jgi:hypothetical protein